MNAWHTWQHRGPQKCYVKWKTADTRYYGLYVTGYHSWEVSRKETESRSAFAGAGGEAEAEGKWTLERVWGWWKSPIGKFSSQGEYHQNLEIETGWNIVDRTYLPARHKQKNGANTWNSSSQTWGNRQHRISERIYKGSPTGTSDFYLWSPQLSA